MISVIIPALDEERALPATLRALSSQTGECEIIVVDGGSTDATTSVVRDLGQFDPRIRLLESAKGRAQQMNAGADTAAGKWLLFLHADTLLPANGLERIASFSQKTQAGCFRHRFSGSGPMLRTLSWFHNQRFKVTRVIYGDQGLFVRRALFADLGGFPAGHMEDINFGLKLRRVTRPVLAPEAVITDSRKFEQMGAWSALLHAVSLLLRHRYNAEVEGDPFFRDYR